MNRLAVRLMGSHILVAVLGAIATFVVVRLWAPALFDESMRMGPAGNGQMGPGQMGNGQMGMGQGGGAAALLRTQFADAVNRSLAVGVVVGILAAGLFGAVAAYRLIRPLNTVRAATRDMAHGRYAVPIAAPRDRELAELVTDVNTLGHALAETETRRIRLLGEVAHEMRTPLTVIGGYVEGMADGVLPATAESVAAMGTEVRRLTRLVDDLSVLSRAEEGRLDMHFGPIDLGATVAAAAERLRPQVADAGIEFAVEQPGGLSARRADPERLAQVVTNLVGNAIRATPAGGRISVSVTADPQAPDVAVIAVSDTGEGLSADDTTRIFERFYRVGGRRTTLGDSGSGIGLTISREIVNAHGGTMSAESPGRGLGARFIVRIPLT